MSSLMAIMIISFLVNLSVGTIMFSVYRIRRSDSFKYLSFSCFTFCLAQILSTIYLWQEELKTVEALVSLALIASSIFLFLSIFDFARTEKINTKHTVHLFVLPSSLYLIAFKFDAGIYFVTTVETLVFLSSALLLKSVKIRQVRYLSILRFLFVIHAVVLVSRIIYKTQMPDAHLIGEQTNVQMEIFLITHVILATMTAIIWPLIIFLDKESKLIELAEIDPLTGIFNRRGFDRRSIDYLSRHERDKTGYIIMIDIDHFKNINDIYGHDIGDEVLKWLSLTVKKCIRDDDIFARLGGEEFIILAPNLDIDAAREISERIRATIDDKPFFNGEFIIRVTVSVGLASEKQQNDSLTSWIKRADTCLYRAKESGRNRVIENVN